MDLHCPFQIGLKMSRMSTTVQYWEATMFMRTIHEDGGASAAPLHLQSISAKERKVILLQTINVKC